MIYIVIYLVGFFVTYLSIRYYSKHIAKSYKFQDAVANFIISLFSWIGFLFALYVFLNDENIKKEDAPWWL